MKFYVKWIKNGNLPHFPDFVSIFETVKNCTFTEKDRKEKWGKQYIIYGEN